VKRLFIVEHYLASRSYLTCQNEFRDTFPDSPVPNKSKISRLVNRFRDTGSVQDTHRSGRPSVLSDEILDDISQTLLRSPRKSLKKLSLQSGLSYGSVHKANRTCIRNGLCDFSITLYYVTRPHVHVSLPCFTIGLTKIWLI
jgi:hypothetical protein